MCPTRSLLIALAAAACGLLSTGAAHAQRTVTSEVKTLHEWANLSGTASTVSGSSGLPIMFVSFRGGNIDLSAALRSGTTHGRITVSVSGYADGVYTVDAVTESSGSTVALGTLTVSSPSWSGTGPVVDPVFPIFSGGPVAGPVVQTDCVQKGGAASAIFLPPWLPSSGQVILGGAVNPFPAGFNPFDVATISLSDSNGNVVSTGTLAPVSHGYLTELGPLSAGSAAPDAAGYAVVRANSAPLFLPMAASGTVVSMPIMFFHPKTGSIAIHATGLPPSEAVTVYANSTQTGAATTGTDGSLNVFEAQGTRRRIPSSLDMFTVDSVTVEDGSDNVLVSGTFQ